MGGWNSIRALALVLAAAVGASAQTVRVDRVVAAERIVIGSTTLGTTSPLQITGLPGALTIAGVVIYDSSGNLGTSTDYPRKSTSQTITGGWTFNTVDTAIAGATLSGTINLTGTLSDNTGALSLGDSVELDGKLDVRYASDTAKSMSITVSSAGDATLDLTTAARAFLFQKKLTLADDLAVNGGDLTATGALNITPGGALQLNPTGAVTLTPSTDVALTPSGETTVNTGGNSVRPTNNYEENLGSLTKKWLSLHAAELWVETLVAQNTIATIGGRILVGPTTTFTVDLAATPCANPQSTGITVKHNEMAINDIVYAEANGSLEFFLVTAGPGGSAGAYTYTVTRTLDTVGGCNAWVAGDALFNTGTTNDGFMDLYSVASIKGGTELGPTIVGNFRTSTTYNAWSPRWAIGRLDGLYGYTSTSCGTGTTYPCVGAAFGDPAEANVVIDAWNGIRIRDGTTNKLTMDTSGNLSLVGDIIMGTGGVIRSGATAIDTGTGYWLAHNSGTPQFRIGNPASNRLRWDGTYLRIYTADLTIDENGPRLLTNRGSTPSEADLNAYRFVPAASGTWSYGLYGFEDSDNNAYGGKDVSMSLIARSNTTTHTNTINIITGAGDAYNNAYRAYLTLYSGNSNDISAPYDEPYARLSGGDVEFGYSPSGSWSGVLAIRSANNSTSPGYPWITGNGDTLMINSDASPLYFNNYSSQSVYIYGDGNTYLYKSGGPNILHWRTDTGLGAPTFNALSGGTRLDFYNISDADDTAYAIGMEASTFWFGVPSTTRRFRWYQGTTQMANMQSGGANNNEFILEGRTTNSGSDIGSVIGVGYGNNSNTDLPGMLYLVEGDGGYGFLFINNDGNLVIANCLQGAGGCTADVPEADGTPTNTNTDVTIVGTQSSNLASKTVLGEYLGYDAALQVILQAPLYTFTYNTDSRKEPYLGVVTDFTPEFGRFEGTAFNPVNAFGYTVAAFKALQAQVTALQARVRTLEAR